MSNAIATSGPHEGRPAHPKYGLPLSGLPKVIEGVTFRPYRAGVLRYVRISDDFRVELWTRDASIYVRLDGESLGGRFRFERTAVAAALRAIAKAA